MDEVHDRPADGMGQRWPGAELDETLEQYRRIFESTSDGLIINDPATGCVVEANPAVCRMHGYTRDEFVGLHATAFIHPDYHPVFVDFVETITGGGTYQTEALDTRKDGSVFPVEVNGSSVMYHGRPHILAVVRDVSVRLQSEAELREREEQYRSIFEATTDGMAIVDMTGVLVEVNPAFSRMYGYTREELLGLPVTALVHPDYHYAVPEGLRRVSERDPYQGRGINVRKDGTSFHMEGHAVTFTYRGAPHILSIIRDITDQVVAEQAVTEERQRLSRELHDSVSQALYSIALGARTARAVLEPGDPAIEPVEFVLAQAERGLAEMRALIFELRPEVLEQEGLVRSLRRQGEALQARRQIAVSLALCEEPALPFPAKEALYRIAQEALHNAVKHARATQVSLSLVEIPDEVMLEIRDDGIGFDTRSSFPGHVGLHSMRERAERASGALQIRSVPGAGTTICASVPVVSQDG